MQLQVYVNLGDFPSLTLKAFSVSGTQKSPLTDLFDIKNLSSPRVLQEYQVEENIWEHILSVKLINLK